MYTPSLDAFNSTQKYYQPLFNTLEKSRVAQENQVSRVSNQLLNNTQYGAQSRVTTKMRSLSPQQAQIIRRQTIIPHDKQLVPTNNLWKIRGKQFAVVDVEVKQGTPVTIQSLKYKQHKKPVIQETVYELRHKNRVYSPPHSYISSRVMSPLTSYQHRRVASPVKILSTPTYSLNFPLKQPVPLQVSTKNSRASQNIASINVDQSIQRLRSPNRQPIELLKNKKTKQPYKYNLFSAVDQFVNSGCNKCGSNQIVATKPENNNWK